MFGSPLALVLAYRKITASSDRNSFIPRPLVNQVYNLFHPTEPVAARLEPLISARFSLIAPVNIAEYGKYPLGNGQPYHLRKYIKIVNIELCKYRNESYIFQDTGKIRKKILTQL